MTDLRPEVANLGSGEAISRPGKADLKSKEVYSRTGNAILRLDYEPLRDGTFDRKQKKNCPVLNHRSSAPLSRCPKKEKQEKKRKKKEKK